MGNTSQTLLLLCLVLSAAFAARSAAQGDFCQLNNKDGIGICSSMGFRAAGRGYNSRTHAQAMSQAERAMNSSAQVADIYGNMTEDGIIDEREPEKVYRGNEPEPTRSTQLGSARGKRQAEVSNCQEKCYYFRPYWALTAGFGYRPVIQFPWFQQWMRTCVCNGWQCSGKTNSNEWWGGKCVHEYAWKKLWVWMGWWPAYVNVKYYNGCCCVPWNYVG